MMRSLLFLCFLLPFVTSQLTRGDECNGNDYGTAGQFDFYVFAQSWPAQFCVDHSSYPGCENPTNFQQNNLTIHGLWPNYAQEQGSHWWPQCCSTSFDPSIDPSVFSALKSSFQKYWPNEQDPSGGDLQNSLWNHEWGKHGTCSGLDQMTYFKSAMSVELINPTPPAIYNNIGGYANLSDLLSYYQATSCTSSSDCYVALQCSGGSGNNMLSGVTTCFDVNFNQIKCPNAVLSSQGDLCTDPQIGIGSFNSKKKSSEEVEIALA